MLLVALVLIGVLGSTAATLSWRAYTSRRADAAEGLAISVSSAQSQLRAELVTLAVLAGLAAIGVVALARRLDRSHGLLLAQRDDLRAVGALAAALATSSTTHEVAIAARRALTDTFTADVVWVALVDDDSERLDVLAGLSEDGSDSFGSMPLDTRAGLPEAARLQQRSVLTAEDDAGRFPSTAAEFRAEGLTGVVYAPFRSHTASGAVGMAYRTPFSFRGRDHRLLDGMLSIIAQAFARARALERERQVSITLQRALLPTTSATTVGRLQRALRYEPGAQLVEVGGDWYDLFELPDGRFGVVIGDVVGRGAPAAATMGQIRMALRASAPLCGSAAEVLEHLDRSVAHLPGALMTTALFGILDIERQQVTFASAGHLPPILSGPDGTRALAEISGPAIGLNRPGQARRQTTIALEPEATLVLYTDGLVERRDEPIDISWERLAREVAAHRHLPIERMADAVLRDCRVPDSHDDVALALLRIPGRPSQTFSLRLPAESSSLRILRDRLREWLSSHPVSPEGIDDVVLAVNEATANAVEHAYGPRTRDDFLVEAFAEDTAFEITVTDLGRWDPRPSDEDRGRGLKIIEALSDALVVDRGAGGTKLTIRFENVDSVRRGKSLPMTD